MYEDEGEDVYEEEGEDVYEAKGESSATVAALMNVRRNIKY